MSARLWPRLALDAAGTWVIAATFAASVWLGDPVPLWLPVAAYILTAAARRLSRGVGITVLVIVSILAVFALGRPEGMPFLVAVGTAFRALSLRREAPYWALRTEFMTGLSMLTIVAILRLALGTPPSADLVLPAALVVAAGLFGLPYVHSLDAAGSSGTAAAAAPGLRLGGLILGASAVFGLLVEGVRLLYLGGHLDFLAKVVYWISYPFVYLFFWIGSNTIGRIHLRGHAGGPGQTSPVPPIPKPRPLSPGAALTLHIGEVLLLLMAAGLILYLIYRRQSRDEEDSAERNAADAEDGIEFGRVTRAARRRLDYGEGARAKVRAAVGRHVVQRTLPPGETARQVAAREEWPEGALQSYERARYRFGKEFEDAEATGFVQRFAEWRRRRGRTGRG